MIYIRSINYKRKILRMLKPILPHKTIFNADINTKNPVTGEYVDPLMKWPMRGAAFTNEIGEALRPLIGGYATLTWAPALLYIGADVYDKYKNDQTQYSPDSRRCLKQAIFQGLASILLPIVAVKGGQNLFSLFGMLTKDKVTFNAQDQIIELAQQFVDNGKMRAYRDKDTECIKDFLDIVDNNLSYRNFEERAKNPFKESFQKAFKLNTKDKIDKYAQRTIKKLISTRKNLLNPTDLYKETSLYSQYKYALESGQTKNVAVKSVLNQYLSKKTMKGRFVKTAGGFIALGLAISPIDKFVEHVLIGKVIGPSIDKTKKPTNM